MNFFSKILSKFTGRDMHFDGTVVNSPGLDGYISIGENGEVTFNRDYVSPDRIYNLKLARDAIHRIAQECSKSTPKTLKPSKRIEYYLSKYPNQYQTISQFIEQAVTLLLSDNGVYIVPLLDRYGQINGLLNLPVNSCQVVDVDGKLWLRHFIPGSDGETAVIEYEKCGYLSRCAKDNMFKSENNSPFMKTGLLYEKNLDRSMIAIKQTQTPIRWIGKITQPFNNSDDIKQHYAKLAESFKLAKKTGALIYDGRFERFEPNKQDVTFLTHEDMKQIENAAYNSFGVSEAILQNKYTEDDWNGFYQSCLKPILNQLEQVLTRMIYTPSQIMNGNGVYMDNEPLQYASMKTRMAVAFGGIDRGAMTKNTGLSVIDMPGIGPAGDVLTIRGEYHDVDSTTGKVIESNGKEVIQIDSKSEGEDSNPDNAIEHNSEGNEED